MRPAQRQSRAPRRGDAERACGMEKLSAHGAHQPSSSHGLTERSSHVRGDETNTQEARLFGQAAGDEQRIHFKYNWY